MSDLEDLQFPEHEVLSAADPASPEEERSFWDWLNGRDGEET